MKFSGCQRLVPGLDIELEVLFTPKRKYTCQKHDQTYEIELLSDLRGKHTYRFLFPIIRKCRFSSSIRASNEIYLIAVLSPNPSLTLPKEIILPRTCTSVPTFSTMYVCNNSPSIQRFHLTVPKELIVKPFKKTYSVFAGSHETLLVQANPTIVGDLIWEMQLTFDSEKQILIKVKSSSVEFQPIHLKASHISFPDTYVGQKSMRATQIFNDSAFKLKFEFCTFKRNEEEELFINRNEENEVELGNKRHVRSIPFQSQYFDIIPAKGDIPPKSSATISICFHPSCELEKNEPSTCIEETAYLKYVTTTKKNNHIELNITGVVVGPKIHFETNEILLRSVYCGEAIEFHLTCTNSGPIDCEITFQEIASRFGAEVSVDPAFLLLTSNEVAIFHVKYINYNVGRFCDTLKFGIFCGKTLHVTVLGKVKLLIAHVTPAVVNFGQVSICCRQYQCIRIKNILKCPINVNFELGNKDQRSEGFILSFDEFEAKSPSKTYPKVDPTRLESTVSLASCQTSQDDFNSGIETLLSEYEKIVDKASSSQVHTESIHSSVEVVNSILGYALGKVDEYLDFEDYRENLEMNIYKTIDDWIENKKVIELLLDDVMQELIENYEPNTQLELFTPFFEKDWVLDENAQEYNLNVSGPLILEPHQIETIRLNLVPNWPGIFRTRLNIFISWDGDPIKNQTCSKVIAIPLIHNCVIPNLVLDHSDSIELEMYAGQTSCKIIRIKNLDENIDGFICAPQYKTNEILIRSTPHKEIVPRSMEVNFNIKITPYVTGCLEHTYEMYVLGNDKPISITFKIRSKLVRIKANPNVVETQFLMPDELAITKFMLMNLCPVKLEYELKIVPFNAENYTIESCDRFLRPYDIVQVEVRQRFDTPGYYEACCWVEIKGDYGVSFINRVRVR